MSGRPFPLKGRYMANVFVHFEPIGHVGEEIAVEPDLPQYVIRGEFLCLDSWNLFGGQAPFEVQFSHWILLQGLTKN